MDEESDVIEVEDEESCDLRERKSSGLDIFDIDGEESEDSSDTVFDIDCCGPVSDIVFEIEEINNDPPQPQEVINIDDENEPNDEASKEGKEKDASYLASSPLSVVSSNAGKYETFYFIHYYYKFISKYDMNRRTFKYFCFSK